MEAIEQITFVVVGRLGGLADAGNHHELFRLNSKLCQRPFQGSENGKIPTSRTPGDIDIFHVEKVRLHAFGLLPQDPM